MSATPRVDALASMIQAVHCEYVKCICLWHPAYPDERIIGKPDCPAHPGDDCDESKYDRDE
ncbi:hypothetical protein EV580_1335 [Mycobacterium sp. BK086]|uniref:hypothetical protein n=1 Tax=Mycobacterium sp. BK086 TaxID=2512165 RepID=UPI00105D60E9|nr:hypothetical protein [Mycobacterium sp. BK086]TDO18152.1 hypothetical protein EV580_1335 [Mycobacterium sp. BK086]